MTAELECYLEGARCDFRAALASRGKGETEKAYQLYLASSEMMFKAARLSKGALRESRMQIAQNLLAEAQSLNRAHPAGKKYPKKVPQPTGDDKEGKSWIVSERPDISFDDVAGLEEVKEQIRLKLLYPFTHPELAEKYQIQAGGGILLYGPPGTGKTLIARAVAGEIEATFFAIKPSEVMSKWVGEAEQNVALLFAEAAAYPVSVIFLDEMEALAPKRRSSHSTVMKRVVPQLLAEMQGFHERKNALLFIGATNEPWEIDVAVMRPGRLDRLIYVPPPDSTDRHRRTNRELQRSRHGFSGAARPRAGILCRYPGWQRPLNTYSGFYCGFI